jgi:hypothetical protein
MTVASPEHADRSAAMVAAAKNRHDATRRQAADALRHLHAVGEEVNFAAVARAAGVSRAWLYHDPQLRAEIDRIRTGRRPSRPALRRPVAEQTSQESLHELRVSLQAELKALREENRRLREALARKLGEQRGTDSAAPT